MFYSIFYYALGYIIIVTGLMIGIGQNIDVMINTGTPLTVLGTALGGGLIALGPRLGPAYRSVFSRNPGTGSGTRGPAPKPPGAEPRNQFLTVIVRTLLGGA